MALTHNVLPGDPLTVAAVNANFTALESLVEGVKAVQVEGGSVFHRHISGALATATSTAGSTAATTPIARILPNANLSRATTSGEAFLVYACVPITASHASADGVITLRVYTDAGGTPGTPVAVGTPRTWQLGAGDSLVAVMVWVGVASASTHRIEVWADATNMTIATSESRLVVWAVHR